MLPHPPGTDLHLTCVSACLEGTGSTTDHDLRRVRRPRHRGTLTALLVSSVGGKSGQQLEVLVRFSGVDASGAAPCVAVPLSSAAKHVATAIFPLNFPER